MEREPFWGNFGRRFLFLSQGGIRDFYISQHFPEETKGEGKLLVGAQLAVAWDQPPLALAWCLYGEASLTLIARGCFASSEGRGDRRGNKSTEMKNKEFLKV